jgi:SAM-dependent methyltransferase
MPAENATTRFAARVENYIRYRPGYPPEVLDLLRQDCGLTRSAQVVDIGCGTGIFARLLLQHGNPVTGIEPNREMREAGIAQLAGFAGFRCVDGSAESTSLPAACADFVTTAQAAHWFDREHARAEFARILKPGGWVVLLWNERCTGTTPFLIAYEELLLRFGTDYTDVRHERTTDSIAGFFAPSPYRERQFQLRQEFDSVGLEGRLLSSSYAPAPGHSNCAPMLRELRRIFDAHQQGGRVAVDYITRVYYSQLGQQR